MMYIHYRVDRRQKGRPRREDGLFGNGGYGGLPPPRIDSAHSCLIWSLTRTEHPKRTDIKGASQKLSMSAFGLIATALAPRADVSCHTSSRLLLTRSGHASPQTSWAVPYLQVFWSKPLMRHKQQLIAVLVQEKFNVLRSLAVKPIHKGDSENYKRRFRLQDFV